MSRSSVAEQGEEEEEGGESLCSPNDACNLKQYAKHCRVISLFGLTVNHSTISVKKYGRFGLGDEDQKKQIIK